MHEHGARRENIPSAETFPGMSLPPHAGIIRGIIEVLGSKTILDYGSGKGKQYEPINVAGPDGTTFTDFKSFWAVDSITCYDPCFPPFEKLPEKRFDGVFATDVLEHCPREDLPWIIEEIFSFAEEFVFISVACYPAKKTLPNGENAHCTIEEPKWWHEFFDQTVALFPSLRYYAAIDTVKDVTDDNGKKISRQLVTGKCKFQG